MLRMVVGAWGWGIIIWELENFEEEKMGAIGDSHGMAFGAYQNPCDQIKHLALSPLFPFF